jgi:hypothetical protein
MLNLTLIERQLFADPTIRARLIRECRLDPAPTTPAELSAGLVTAFAQIPREAPLEAGASDSEVYRAAVLALASNSRS